MALVNRKKLVIITLVLALATLGLKPLKANVEITSLCRMTKDGLKSRLPYVSHIERSQSTPSAACCSAIANAEIPCLCLFKGSTLLSFYGVDPDLAMQLPAKCNLGQAFRCQ